MADATTAALLDCDFLKAGHHGSHTSSNEDFLEAVTPELVAISCGKKGVGTNASHKHPRYERVRALLGHAGPRQGLAINIDAYDSARRQWRRAKLNAAVYATSGEGHLVFERDGNLIRRKQ